MMRVKLILCLILITRMIDLLVGLGAELEMELGFYHLCYVIFLKLEHYGLFYFSGC